MKLRSVIFDVRKRIIGDTYHLIGYDGYCNSYEAIGIVKEGEIISIAPESLILIPWQFDLNDECIDEIGKYFPDDLKHAI